MSKFENITYIHTIEVNQEGGIHDNGDIYAFWGSRSAEANQEGGNHDNGEFYAFCGSRSTKEKKKVEIMIMDIGEIYAFWGSDTKITLLIEIIFFKPYL